MKKFLLSLGLVAAIVAPAAAGNLDNAAPVSEVTQPQPAQQPDVDYTTTRSINREAPSAATNGQPTSIQRGDQGSAFGANGR